MTHADLTDQVSQTIKPAAVALVVVESGPQGRHSDYGYLLAETEVTLLNV